MSGTAYLDIETTGLSRYDDKITVVGVGIREAGRFEITQLVGTEVRREALLGALRGAAKLFTYNGSRFDIPFIKEHTGIDLAESLEHRDLMFDCWDRRLFGGLKAVEEKLGIPRRLPGITGLQAIDLWHRWKYSNDQKALDLLLKYNREDVANLEPLRRILALPGSPD